MLDNVLYIESNYQMIRENIVIIMDYAQIHRTPYVLKLQK